MPPPLKLLESFLTVGVVHACTPFMMVKAHDGEKNIFVWNCWKGQLLFYCLGWSYTFYDQICFVHYLFSKRLLFFLLDCRIFNFKMPKLFWWLAAGETLRTWLEVLWPQNVADTATSNKFENSLPKYGNFSSSLTS